MNNTPSGELAAPARGVAAAGMSRITGGILARMTVPMSTDEPIPEGVARAEFVACSPGEDRCAA
jgi:hypothetical protein